MIIPVRCFTCGKVIGHLWEQFYQAMEKNKVSAQDVFKELGIERYCCRRMMMSHVNLINYLSAYDLPTEAFNDK